MSYKKTIGIDDCSNIGGKAMLFEGGAWYKQF